MEVLIKSIFPRQILISFFPLIEDSKTMTGIIWSYIEDGTLQQPNEKYFPFLEKNTV